MDYHNEFEKFYGRNRYKDVYFEFKEQRLIPGMIHHNLIKLGVNDPFLLNYFFILSTLLSYSEIYKLYFNYLCIFQRFKVRKLISTRYDLINQFLKQNIIHLYHKLIYYIKHLITIHKIIIILIISIKLVFQLKKN